MKNEISPMTPKIAYCIDSNYWKGTTWGGYNEKHRRQLIIEVWYE